MKKVIYLGILIFSINQVVAQGVWQFYENTQYEQYKEANEQLLPLSANEYRVVFMGNSITDNWPIKRPLFFENSNFVGRGINGQL